MKLSKNTLYIVSTPIGNLDDITFRAIEVLKNSDIILCEDTRRSLKLLNHLKIKKKLIAYHKFNEKKQINNIIKHFNQGKILSIISDAGTPTLSDPGRLLLNECINESIKIVPVPGASSITTAVSASGFSDKFLFYGFLPKKENEIEKILSSFVNFKFSIVFFIPALKINLYLDKFKKYFKGRKIMFAKEMTKLHEEFFRGSIDSIEYFNKPQKGEFTVVVSESITKIYKLDQEKIINKAKKFLKKYSLKDTVNLIMESEKINKKKIYSICLKIKNEKNN